MDPHEITSLIENAKRWIEHVEHNLDRTGSVPHISPDQIDALRRLYIPRQSSPAEPDIAGENWIGKLNEYHQANPHLSPPDFREVGKINPSGTQQWQCLVKISECQEPFPQPTDWRKLGHSSPPSFAKKSHAKHWASKCAFQWIIARDVQAQNLTSTRAPFAPMLSPTRPQPRKGTPGPVMPPGYGLSKTARRKRRDTAAAAAAAISSIASASGTTEIDTGQPSPSSNSPNTSGGVLMDVDQTRSMYSHNRDTSGYTDVTAPSIASNTITFDHIENRQSLPVNNTTDLLSPDANVGSNSDTTATNSLFPGSFPSSISTARPSVEGYSIPGPFLSSSSSMGVSDDDIPPMAQIKTLCESMELGLPTFSTSLSSSMMGSTRGGIGVLRQYYDGSATYTLRGKRENVSVECILGKKPCKERLAELVLERLLKEWETRRENRRLAGL